MKLGKACLWNRREGIFVFLNTIIGFADFGVEVLVIALIIALAITISTVIGVRKVLKERKKQECAKEIKE